MLPTEHNLHQTQSSVKAHTTLATESLTCSRSVVLTPAFIRAGFVVQA